jgi:hypothetical protein
VIVSAHSCYDYTLLAREAPLIVDTVNATKGVAGQATVVRLGAPR